MLRSVKELRGYHIAALDGEVGKVDDLYADDVGWFIRYVVVNTGNWLAERRVLVSPEAFGSPDWESRSIPVQLEKATIEESPPVETEDTVSRQEEERLRSFYGWPNWWTTPMTGMIVPTAQELEAAKAREAVVDIEDADPHLRSVREILGYHIETTGGDIGHVDDLIVDDRGWVVRYFVVDTKNFLPGKKVIVSPHWVEDIRWQDRKVALDLRKAQIEDAPRFDPREPIQRVYEERLYDFFGRPRYW
jgi:hypothetical protein